MSNAQQLFKTIVLHNKLMEEADVDALLRQTPEPDQAIAAMVVHKTITEQVSVQLIALYHKKLEHADHGHPPHDAHGAQVITTMHHDSAPTHPLVESHTASPPPAHTPPALSPGTPSVAIGASPIDVTKGGKE